MLWGAVVFGPLFDRVLNYCGTFLVDETGGLELAAVLLDIGSKDAAVTDDFRGCYP